MWLGQAWHQCSPKATELSALEQDVMRICWQLEEFTSAEVIEEFCKSRQLADTTIRTVLTKLREKGYVDVVLLGALVWASLRLFRRCPPRLAALLWLVVFAKPLVTLTVGPAVSVLSIPLPSYLNSDERLPSAFATSKTDRFELAESRQLETLPLPVAGPITDATSTAVECQIDRPAQPIAIPAIAEPRETQANLTSVATNGDVQPTILSEDGDLSSGARPIDQLPDSIEQITDTVPPMVTRTERPIGESVRLLPATSWLVVTVAVLWVVVVA